MNMMMKSRPFRIWQQNVAKSSTAQHDLLAKAKPQDWDVIALQEPYLNHLQLTHANPHWNVIYPSNRNLDRQARVRSILLINTNIPSGQVSQIVVQSSDVTAMRIETTSRPLILINIYNDNTHSRSIDAISNEWTTHEGTWLSNPDTELLILGDFNWHHSTWEVCNNAHLTSQDRLLTPLLDLVVNMRLEMALPHGIPTLEARNTGNWTRPDNVWRCADTPSPFVSCDVNPALRPVHMDHLPVISSLDLTYTPSPIQIQYNFRGVNWETYRDRLATNLEDILTVDLTDISNAETLEWGTNQIFEAIAVTTQAVVPQAKISPHTKRWWNSKLTAIRKVRNRASAEKYRWRGLPEHPIHEEYKMLNRRFARVIEKAKADHWSKWIKHIGGSDIWSIHHYMKAEPTDYGRRQLPDIRNGDGSYARTNEDKAQRLAKTFFPPAQPPSQDEHQFVEKHPPRSPWLPDFQCSPWSELKKSCRESARIRPQAPPAFPTPF